MENVEKPRATEAFIAWARARMQLGLTVHGGRDRDVARLHALALELGLRSFWDGSRWDYKACAGICVFMHGEGAELACGHCGEAAGRPNELDLAEARKRREFLELEAAHPRMAASIAIPGEVVDRFLVEHRQHCDCPAPDVF